MKVFTSTALALTVTLASCGGSTESKSTTTVPTDTTATAAPAAAAAPAATATPAATITPANWVTTDLSKVAPGVDVVVSLPKDAKKEKNPNGGVDVTLSDGYVIVVSEMGVSTIKAGKENAKALSIDRTDSYINAKVLQEDANGYVYTEQMHYADSPTTYQPEYHFAYFLEKNSAVFSIEDERPLTNSDLPGSAYSEAIARQVYDLIKASAKIK